MHLFVSFCNRLEPYKTTATILLKDTLICCCSSREIMGARRFIHNTIRTPNVSYTNHKNCNVSYTSFVKYRIYVAIVNEIVC